MSSPTRRPAAQPRATRWLRRVGGTVAATTAGAVLLAGSPVTLTPPGPADAGDDLEQVSASTRRWPGHPGRTLVRHRVRPGETATGLAVRFHAWTAELRALNHLHGAGHLLAGRVVTIPVVDAAVPRARRAHHRHAARPGRHPHRHAHRHARRHPWVQAGASRATVRRLVVRTARRHGVDPHLALAISWQESGWQQHRRSSTGAIGAMQVMPDTGRWMSLYAGRRLNIYSLRDNVTAGVVLITVLRHQVSRRRAIAAYYQGLGAVQERGLYPSTRRYTRSVLSLYHRLHRGWRPA